jgi:hypothetical protein
MIQSRSNPLQFSQIYLLLVGLSVGYVGFILWLGMRPVVLLSGATIAGLTVAIWCTKLQPRKTTVATSANLLQPDVFLSHICFLDRQIPDAAQLLWQSVQQRSQTIQQIAMQLAQLEPAFIPDLLETLHTVLDLIDQLVQALQITQQIQTPRYRELAQQQLETSLNRLQYTHGQLQELHDQIVCERLEQHSYTAFSSVSIRLQTLIAENTSEISSGILGD